jgi:hypothetical protein
MDFLEANPEMLMIEVMGIFEVIKIQTWNKVAKEIESQEDIDEN